MHQLHASSLCDIDETEPDILSHAYDRVSQKEDRDSKAEPALSGARPPVEEVSYAL
jgi:hypothetical protein